jgi:hypothetical protein
MNKSFPFKQILFPRLLGIVSFGGKLRDKKRGERSESTYDGYRICMFLKQHKETSKRSLTDPKEYYGRASIWHIDSYLCVLH